MDWYEKQLSSIDNRNTTDLKHVWISFYHEMPKFIIWYLEQQIYA